MPGKGYPSDRVATTKYEKGDVKSGRPAKSEGGSDKTKTGRAGK